MKQKKFFHKFLENFEKLDHADIKNFITLIEKERETFSSLLNGLDLGLIVLDQKNIIFVNNKARDMLYISDYTSPLHQSDINHLIKNKGLFDKILNTDWDHQSVITLSDQRNRIYEVQRITTDLGYFIIKLKDVTQQKDLEFKLKQFESIAALNTMAAGIAHEIKNPLAAIDLHTQIIKKGVKNKVIFIPEEVENYIHIVEEETQRLNNILNDFLLSARKRELKLSFIDLNHYLAEIIKFMMPLIEEKKILLDEEYGDIPKIFIDKEYLKQAILNLLKNAVEAMEKSDVKRIRISTFYDLGRDSVGFSICDTGEGMKEETIQKIFEPYYSSKDSGTGLGLTIVYKIIKEHGGDILVDSTLHTGTTFVVYLPIRQGQRLLKADHI